MRKLVAAAIATLAVVAVTVSPTFAERRAASSAAPKLALASQLPRTRGASRAPLGWVPLHAEGLARAKAAANARAGLGGGNRPRGGGGGGPTVFSLLNVSPSFNGASQAGLTPPDTTGTIGPDRYIEIINTAYAIYNRSGTKLGSGSLSALTGIPGGLFGYSLSDPQMMWDAQTGRFYYSAVFYDPFLLTNGLAVGWSKTATPSSSSDWCQYEIETPDPNSLFDFLPDYPKLGDSKDFLIYGFNKFADAASTYVDSEFLALNKPPAGTTCADPSLFTVTESGALHNKNGTLAATPVPARLVDDSTGTGYVVADADLSDTTLYPPGTGAGFVTLYTVTTSGAPNVAAISGPSSVAVPEYRMPASAPQAGSSFLLDTLDGRFEAAVAGFDPGRGTVGVWAAHAVASAYGTTVEERWYELTPSSASPLDSGVVTDPSLFIWNGAISPDRSNAGGTTGGSWALSVSTSSPTTFPAIRLKWKKAGGSASALTNIVQSNGPLVDFSCSSTTPCRYGDYSGASPDPAATGPIGKIWLANQYNLASGSTSGVNWRTWILAVTPS